MTRTRTNGRLTNGERIALAATALSVVAAGAGPARAAAAPSIDGALDAVRAAAHRDPLKAVLATVAASATAFFLAERSHNPRIATFDDALLYCATCLSVGYDRTFPVTPTGKRIATALQTLGPALAARALDPPAR